MAATACDTDSNSNNKLSYTDIKELGGEENDLELINEYISDDEEEIVKNEDSDSDDEPLSRDELRDFIRKLGFKDVTNKLVIVKDEENVTNEEAVDSTENKVAKSKKEKKIERLTKYNIEEKARVIPKPIAIGGLIKDYANRNYMLAKPEMKWYENEVSVQAENVSFSKLDLPSIMKFENHASQLLQKDVELYQKYIRSAKRRSDFHWTQTVLKSGTTSDKMAAYIILVQDSPVHTLNHLEQLIKMVDVKTKGEGLMAIDTLKDLFIGDLLLENKKLRSFDQQPLGSLDSLSAGNADAYNKLLLLWHFESCLKQKYLQFVTALLKIATESIDAYKRKALKAMFDLLLQNPEQEQILLSNIVNKLGDPSHKIASQTSYFLCRLLDKHPQMKSVIVKEVERLLFRPNVSPKASYFGVCFLNQIILDVEDRDVAAKLTSIYFALFRGATKKGEVDSKMMTALLTGANRAFPYAKLDSATISDHINATYKIIPTMNFNIGVQALTLLYHVLDSKDDFSDRFYCSLYRKLLDPELKTTSKQTMFINLLYKSLKRDFSENRMHAFMKRIFQIVYEQTPAMACGLLYMVSEVLRHSSRSLMLISQKSIWEKDDDDEVFHDVLEDLEGDIKPIIASNVLETASQVKASSWVHKHHIKQVEKDASDTMNDSSCVYDPLHRNPLYAIVGKGCPWELIKLCYHYHPSVALFAKTLLDGKFISYNGDPLQDFTLSRFLDRFVYRNPKSVSQQPTDETSETSTVTSQRSVLGKRNLYRPEGARAIPVDSAMYIDKPENSIPVEELFMYKYFSNKNIVNVGSKGEVDDDIESVDSDEFETLMEKFQTGDLKNEYEIDFAAQVKKGIAQKSGKKSKSADDESDDDTGSDDDADFNFDDDDFGDAFKDFEEDIEDAKEVADGDDEVFSDSEQEPKFKNENNLSSDDEEEYQRLQKRPRPSKEEREDTTKLFASAEEFAAVLEENTNMEASQGLEAFANKDNAHLKQLKWEADRDRWVRGVDWKSKRKQGSQQKMKRKLPNGKQKGVKLNSSKRSKRL